MDYRQFMIDMFGQDKDLKNIANYKEVFNDKEVMGAVMSENFHSFIQTMKESGLMKFGVDDCMWLLDQYRGVEALESGFLHLADDVKGSPELVGKLLETDVENFPTKPNAKIYHRTVRRMLACGEFPREQFKKKEWVEIFIDAGCVNKSLFSHLENDEEYMLRHIQRNHEILSFASSRLRGSLSFANKVYEMFDCVNSEEDRKLFESCFIGKVGKAIKTSGVVECFEKQRLEKMVGNGKGTATKRVKI